MLNKEVQEWIDQLREEDRDNTLRFLEVSLGYFSRHQRFLRGSGYYVVGSSYSKRTYVLKKTREEIDELEKESRRRLLERFGEKKLRDYTHNSYILTPDSEKTLTPDEIKIMKDTIDGEYENLRAEKVRRDFYEDIDLVLSGLPQEKSDTKIPMWKGFAEIVAESFPGSLEPGLLDDFFGIWEVYDVGDGIRSYLVHDLALNIPTVNLTTKIHFMIYRSDERFGSKATKTVYDKWFDQRIVITHEPSKNVSRELWKAQQKNDNLPYLTIAEF